MKILVLLKQTFDTEEKIVIEQGRIKKDNVNFVINPYDEYAVEEAVQMKEQLGATVTSITVGPAHVESAIRTALAVGVDEAIWIEQDEQSDEHYIAQLIYAAVKDKGFDFVIGGNMAVDSGSGQVALRVAELLGIAHVSSVTKMSVDGGKAILERDVEGDTEIIEVAFPLLITAQQGLNEPRYPSLPGIMKAKKKPIEKLAVGDLNIPADVLQAKTAISDQYLPQKKQAGKRLAGEVNDQVNELVRLLRQEAKVV